eukprot:252280_1
MMCFLIIHLLLSINTNAQTTNDLPQVQPTAEFDTEILDVDPSHDFHPECNDLNVGLTAPTLPTSQGWWVSPDFDGWGGVGVAFTNAYVDTSNNIIYESPLSALVWKSWSSQITQTKAKHKPHIHVNGIDHCYVNVQIAYLINFEDKTQWKRIRMKDNPGAGQDHTFYPTDLDFASNAGTIVTANSASCTPPDTSCHPTTDPTIDPTIDPTNDPTSDPTVDPTSDPTYDPTVDPTFDPTVDPTFDPTVDPTFDPTVDPTFDPTVDPT